MELLSRDFIVAIRIPRSEEIDDLLLYISDLFSLQLAQVLVARSTADSRKLFPHLRGRVDYIQASLVELYSPNRLLVLELLRCVR